MVRFFTVTTFLSWFQFLPLSLFCCNKTFWQEQFQVEFYFVSWIQRKGVHHGGEGTTAGVESWMITVSPTHRKEGEGWNTAPVGLLLRLYNLPQAATWDTKYSIHDPAKDSPHSDHHISQASWLHRNIFFPSCIGCKSKTQASETRKPRFLWDWVHAFFASPQLLVMAINHSFLTCSWLMPISLPWFPPLSPPLFSSLFLSFFFLSCPPAQFVITQCIPWECWVFI